MSRAEVETTRPCSYVRAYSRLTCDLNVIQMMDLCFVFAFFSVIFLQLLGFVFRVVSMT